MSQTSPITTVNILSNNQGSAVSNRSILLTGQLKGGTATSGELIEDIISEKQLNSYFGRNSQIAIAGRAIIKELSISSVRPSISAIGLEDNASGVEATGSFTITGTATENGILTFYIDSAINGKYDIDVLSGETADEIGDKLELAITNNLDSPVAATNTSGVVALTAVNAGTIGNSIATEITGSVNGLTVAKSGFLLSGGATDPVATNLFDITNDIRFTSIIYPREWGISILTNYTDSVFNVDNSVLDGMGFVGRVDTYQNIKSELDSLNSICYIANKLAITGLAQIENPLVIVAQFVALRELRLTVNSNLSKIAINGLAIGGSYYAGIPYHNMPFFNLPLVNRKNQFKKKEAAEIEKSGGIIIINNDSNTLPICGSALTTYKTDILGNDDITFKYLNYIDCYSIAREFIFNSLKRDFNQHMLVDGKTTAGIPQVNKKSFIATMVGYYVVLSGLEDNPNYLVLRASKEQKESFKKEIENTIAINLSTGVITSRSLANIVSQVRKIIINLIPTFN